MSKRRGPCEECGAPVNRVIKAHRPTLCVPCAMDKQAVHNVAMAEGTSPMYEKACAQGDVFLAQLETRSGPYYERWLAGVLRAAGLESAPPS